jgi:hypothetical protein
MEVTMGVFDGYLKDAWPIEFKGQLLISTICGSMPSDPNTAKAWVESKVKDTRSPSEVAKLVAEVMAEHQVTMESAIGKVAADMSGLNIFKRTEAGVLYIEGRHLKAALKEAVSVAANEGKVTTKGWGNPDNASYKKQIKGWFPEHVFVAETVLPLCKDGKELTEPDGVLQKFVHTHHGDAIGYEEFCEGVTVDFTVTTDHVFTDKQWAMIWLSGGPQGIGASRSQGYGTYEVTRWDQTKGQALTKKAQLAAAEDEAA